MNTDDKINRLELRIHRLEQESAYRLHRLERALGTLISWLPHELGATSMKSLLDTLTAPEDPNCIEGSPHTPANLTEDIKPLIEILWAHTPTSPEQQAYLTSFLGKYPELHPNCLEGHGRAEEEMALDLRKERDEARSLVAAFEKAVNEGCSDGTHTPGHRADRAVSEVDYIFRLHKELRERVEKVIGHWRDTDWFREGGIDEEITVGVNEAEAIKLLKYLKP